MELQIQHDKISSYNVSVRTRGLFSGAKLIVDGKAVKLNKRKYEFGNGAIIELKNRMADPVPDVFIDNVKVEIAPAISGVAYFWAALPIGLIFVGGAVGGLLGGLAAYLNFYIFRRTKNPAQKYVFTFLVTLSAVLVYIITAFAVQTTMKGIPQK